MKHIKDEELSNDSHAANQEIISSVHSRDSEAIVAESMLAMSLLQKTGGNLTSLALINRLQEKYGSTWVKGNGILIEEITQESEIAQLQYFFKSDTQTGEAQSTFLSSEQPYESQYRLIFEDEADSSKGRKVINITHEGSSRKACISSIL